MIISKPKIHLKIFSDTLQVLLCSSNNCNRKKLNTHIAHIEGYWGTDLLTYIYIYTDLYIYIYMRLYITSRKKQRKHNLQYMTYS